MPNFANEIIHDVITNKRPFLPGGPCSESNMRNNLNLPISVAGLTNEESILLLSALPGESSGIYLAPLDKGLSGAKVYSAHYTFGVNKRSRLFVAKLGDRIRVDQESQAIERYAAPHISALGAPITRLGRTRGLLCQDFAGLSDRASLTSLRLFLRNTKHPSEVIFRLFRERLANWYSDTGTPRAFRLRDLFHRHLRKCRKRSLVPVEWTELCRWTRAASRCDWNGVLETIRGLKDATIYSPTSTVHGDLHSQNILIDESEQCWPIDFAWCVPESSPVVDLTMMECSLKFLSVPGRTDIRALLKFENQLCRAYNPRISVGNIPYSVEIRRIYEAIGAVRTIASEDMNISFYDYRKALCILTYSLLTHPRLNLPLVLGSLQILSALTR